MSAQSGVTFGILKNAADNNALRRALRGQLAALEEQELGAEGNLLPVSQQQLTLRVLTDLEDLLAAAEGLDADNGSFCNQLASLQEQLSSLAASPAFSMASWRALSCCGS